LSRVRVTFDERGEVTEYELAPSDDECRRGWQAMMLAPTLEVCRALLHGESVPVDKLRAEWVARFGRRPR
jgi:hypothetical protein